MKADDTVSLDIPFAIYVSKDEPQEEVSLLITMPCEAVRLSV